MKRIFQSDKDVDLLINEYTNTEGISIARFLNIAVRQVFLPRNKTLHVESAYLLQQAAEGKADQDLIRQCISRGITWLGKYPIENPEILRTVILHFIRSPWDDTPGDPANQTVSTLFDNIISKIQESEPDFKRSPVHPFYGNFGEDILDRWEILWNEKIAYDALSAIVYCEEPAKPFTWYDGMLILQAIEIAAEEKHGIK